MHNIHNIINRRDTDAIICILLVLRQGSDDRSHHLYIKIKSYEHLNHRKIEMLLNSPHIYK